MAPDDLTTPTHVDTSHSKHYSTFKFTASQETQLKSFLTYAAYVLESIVARPTQQVSTKLSDVVIEDHSSGRLTDGSTTLMDTRSDDFFDGRLVQFISFKESSSTAFLCCYGSGSSSSGNKRSRQGCICIYDILSKPSLQFTLLVQGVPTCASWSVNTRSRRSNWGVIVAGTEDGSLALWDLSSKPLGTAIPNSPLHPTYSTSYRIEENHTAPTQCIRLDGNSMREGAIGSLGAGMSGNFLKLISLDKLGFVHMWIVKEVQLKTARDDELGLQPDGRLYLVRTGATSVLPRSADALEIALPEACAFAIIPGRVQEILVALSDGTLVKTSLVGSRPSAPRKFIRQALKGSEPVASSIVSLCFSPYEEDCFLVAYADNSVAIFTLDKPHPWGIWNLPSTDADGHIISAQWSPLDLESTVVLVAVSSRKVHVFDISRGLANPKFSETLDSSHDIVCFELSKREAGGSAEYSFITASAIGDVKVHLLRQTSNDYRAAGLKQLLLTPSYMIS